MLPDPARVAETRAWFVKASGDLGAAETLLHATPPLCGTGVFHCQQAAEKAMKAFLTWNDRTFRKTHNLIEVGEACVAIDPSLETLFRRAVPLTEYAWRFRYPGEPDDPTREEADEALVLARKVYEAVLSRLPAEVRP